MKPLIDGDILKYEIGFAAETGWQKEDELPPWEYVAKLFNLRVDNICAIVGATEPPLFFLSGEKNFRNDIAVTKVYKGTRVDNKPYHYYNLNAYIRGMFDHVVSDGIEADDLMCVYQTTMSNYRIGETTTIICTRDKDLRQCPGWHYGWELGRQAQFGPELVDLQGWIELDRTGSAPKIKGAGLSYFYSQLLTGDVVDNVPGLPKCGPVKAYDLLSKCEDHREMIAEVIAQYSAKYGDHWISRLTEQGRLLWMVRSLNEDGSPVMWNIGDTS